MGGERYRAGPLVLGARLLAAAHLVRPGQVTADIGCDHGKLAVYLAASGIAPRVIAVDNRPLPLARAKALVAGAGCDGAVACRLGDGLAPIAPLEATEIVIAGMSGETIIGILQRAPWVQNPGVGLTLVPATRHAQLRRFLCEAGFAIVQEVPVEERSRFYTALSARYTGYATSPTPLFCEVGLVADAGGSAAAGYVAARLAHLRKRALAPLGEPERAALSQLTQEVEACLQSLQQLR